MELAGKSCRTSTYIAYAKDENAPHSTLFPPFDPWELRGAMGAPFLGQWRRMRGGSVKSDLFGQLSPSDSTLFAGPQWQPITFSASFFRHPFIFCFMYIEMGDQFSEIYKRMGLFDLSNSHVRWHI